MGGSIIVYFFRVSLDLSDTHPPSHRVLICEMALSRFAVSCMYEYRIGARTNKEEERGREREREREGGRERGREGGA